jgi:hypothetical protein
MPVVIHVHPPGTRHARAPRRVRPAARRAGARFFVSSADPSSDAADDDGGGAACGCARWSSWVRYALSLFVFVCAGALVFVRLQQPALLPHPLALQSTISAAALQRVHVWDPDPGPLNLKDCAFVTMASSDDSGRLALTLMQTLRDVDTRMPHLVLLLMRGGTWSADCLDPAWAEEHGREVGCYEADARAGAIISDYLLSEFVRLGVEILVHDPIPPTPFTEGIPGGTQVFWGMALNKLQVFGMTQFRKIVWLDSDDFVVRNIDHLAAAPMLTGSLVTACCNENGPGYAGGGIWVLAPNTTLYETLLDVLSKPRPGTLDEGWLLGDMQVIRHIFGSAPAEGATEPLYPAINDERHGYVGGLRYFAAHRDKTDAEFAAWIDGVLDKRKPRVEGFDTTRAAPAGGLNWMALDMRYDQCVGSFDCSPERDDPSVAYSVHFSCLQNMDKPSSFETEADFMDAVAATNDRYRYWYLRWMDTYIRATSGRGLPPPKKRLRERWQDLERPPVP